MSLLRAPSTFGQLSLWRSTRSSPPEVCNLPQVWDLAEGTDRSSVARALQTLETRHESLRTRYEVDDEGALIQVVWPPAAVPLATVECGPDLDGVTRSVVDQQVTTPFDLTTDRPWRACLISRYGTPVRLVLCLHHIAVDAWAIDQLREEFSRLLAGAAFLEPTPTCRALAVEQRSGIRAARRRATRSFWNEILSAAPPMDRVADPQTHPEIGPQEPGGAPGHWACFGSRRAAVAADTVAERSGVSVPAVVLAAFCSTVHRHTGRDSLLIAVHAHNRSDPRWEGLVAVQNQVVPVLVTLTPGEDLGALARRVQTDLLGAFRHGAYDEDEILEVGRAHGYAGSVNGSFDGSVSGFFTYFFTYLGQDPHGRTADEQRRAGSGGPAVGAPLDLEVQDGDILTCTLRAHRGYRVATGSAGGAVEIDHLLELLRQTLVHAGRQP